MENLAEEYPRIGIFFFVDNRLLTDAVPVECGEPYGRFLQFGGHYDYWEAVQPKTVTHRKFTFDRVTSIL